MAFYNEWKPYVPVAVRRRNAAKKLASLVKKDKGRVVSPVVVHGRTIANTFWGKAWCENLERYSDYSNRLPRGRTYVRNGSVMDLQVIPGAVIAMVSGSDLYRVEVKVAVVTPSRWSDICKDCSGGIDSLVELLQGRLSQGVMTRICQEKSGLFPTPAEIKFTCSCPDWASMCKHVAAVLYGIGARLDSAPDLLFALRKVDAKDLIARAGNGLPQSRKGTASKKVLDAENLSEMFGIEMAQDVKAPALDRPKTSARSTPKQTKTVAKSRASSKGFR